LSIDAANLDETFILDRWLNRHWGHPAILDLVDGSLPEEHALRAWLELAFVTDFERWSPQVEPVEDVVIDVQHDEIRVPEPHDGWMPPHMIERDIQSLFG
jgi:hypothetical protein